LSAVRDVAETATVTHISSQKRGRPKVVIVGGGFAGLNTAQALKDAPVEITLIDRRNHHLFQPLLYQVATATLSPADIASPIREVLRKQKNTRVWLDEVTSVDPEQKRVHLASRGALDYDYLILAAGARHSYFGHDEWEPYAPGIKSLEEALDIRTRVLLAFEAAEEAATEEERQALMTFVIVGGGPTGVELAGAITEIAQHSLANEFRSIDTRHARIVLIEAMPRVLPMFQEKLSESAARQLREMGVLVRTNSMVTGIEDGVVRLGEDSIRSATIIWAAGVAASPLGKSLGVPVDRAGRVPVTETLNIPPYPEVFVLGDMATLTGKDGKPLPGVAPVAMQQGQQTGANILRMIRGEAPQPFRYKDRGNMATIGRNRAIAQVGGFSLSGFPAWLAWSAVHVVNLSGYRNRAIVALRWAWSYINHHRGARLIVPDDAVRQL
jgi:NADH:ubiquinone reductase (H+-translocating)